MHLFEKLNFNKFTLKMTCSDRLPYELREMIFKYKRINHFLERQQRLDLLIQKRILLISHNEHEVEINIFVNNSLGVLTGSYGACIQSASTLIQVAVKQT